MSENLRVLCWCDALGISTAERPLAYPVGIHQAVADLFNAEDGFEATAVAADESALSAESLAGFDVAALWAHGRPLTVETQRSVIRAVESGQLGLVGLHSLLLFDAYPLLVGRLLGQTVQYGWEDGVPLRFEPCGGHPVLEGIGPFELTDEAYYEPFGLTEGAEVCLEATVALPGPRQSQLFDSVAGKYVRQPHEVVGLRSRAAWSRQVGQGRVFYFQPGHETDPTYSNPVVRTILRRAARFVAPR